VCVRVRRRACVFVVYMLAWSPAYYDATACRYNKILQRDKRCEDSLAANKMVNSIKARAKRAL